MNNSDTNLIQRTLDGDQQAFAELVEKYQKQIHALAWQKIGDFHIAQEITQDAFLTAYNKLATLKYHNRFAGWLYVIADRKCKNWHRKRKLALQSLDDTDPFELEEVYYSEYMTRQREEAAKRKRRAVVQRLLSTLQESERTVVNLYYIAEMTCEEIGKFMGVSANTVRSRLHRARNKLRKDETMIKENLSSFQLPAQLTENIMKEISNQNPAIPSTSKPLIPLAVSAASAILIIFLLGIGSQNLFQFQQPYSLNALSDKTIEITDAHIVIDTPANPADRNQIGRTNVAGNTNGTGQKQNDPLFAAANADELDTSNTDRQWIQTSGPEGGVINTLFSTSNGAIYTGTSSTLYKLTEDKSSWNLVYSVNTSTINMSDMVLGGKPMFERGDSLFIVTDTEVINSKDRGETWQSLGTIPDGYPVDIAVTDSTLYLGITKDVVKPNEAHTEGVYASEDDGKTWQIIDDSNLKGKKIRAVAAIEETVFVGTDNGLYKFHEEEWKKIFIGPKEMHNERMAIPSIATAENILYVAAGKNYSNTKAVMTKDSWWSLYRSADLGESWESIDPRGENIKSGFSIQFPMPGYGNHPYLGIKVTAKNENVLLSDMRSTYYSKDSGETWTTIDRQKMQEIKTAYPFIVLDSNTYYKGTQSGVYRSTDGGDSWQQFNTGLTSSTVTDLFAVNGKLYGRTNDHFVTSTNGGETWTPLSFNKRSISMMNKFDNSIYLKSTKNNISILRLSSENNDVIEIRNMPKIEDVDLNHDSNFDVFIDKSKQIIEQDEILNLQEDDVEKISQQITDAFQKQAASTFMPLFGSFAVSNETYYMEYRNRLYTWKYDEIEWHDTGIVDETMTDLPFNLFNPKEFLNDLSDIMEMQKSIGFKLAVSGKTIYVGKQNGNLLRSYDEGITWTDVTKDLPLSYEKIQDIKYAESTIYVSTDKGVTYSTDGEKWNTTTDPDGKPIIIKQFTVDGATLYGVVGLHVYHLKQNSNLWEIITPEIPSPISSLAVDDKTLYVGTLGRGVLRFALDE